MKESRRILLKQIWRQIKHQKTTRKQDGERRRECNTRQKKYSAVTKGVLPRNSRSGEEVISTLEKELNNLKKKLADKEETIDYLVQERDEAYNNIYDLRLKLADAWNIDLATDAEKVQEVMRLNRIKKVRNSYCKTTEEDDLNLISSKGSSIEENKSAVLTDSGIDVQSLEKLIDDKVTTKVEEKFKEQARKDNFVPKNLSNDEFVNVVYENKAETTEERDQRDLNLIVHGVKEDDAGSNTDRLVMELFDTIGMEHLSTTPAHRLGSKSPDRIRPIKITLESYEEKLNSCQSFGD